ncbi:MAG: hypothetical protein R3C19_08480 [Planctomycetaceae bacterium]
MNDKTPLADELRQKRVYVGLLSAGCLIGALAAAFVPEKEGLQALLIRVGLLLGAFWLAMPSRNRPAAWAKFSPWTIVGIVLFAAFLPRMKFLLPLLIVAGGIAWLVRPRRK